MNKLILIFFFLIYGNSFAQNQHDENIKALIKQYTVKPEMKCEIIVRVDVEGMHIPEKKVYVEFLKDEKPKVKGEGLSLLPKKGTVDQFSELLSSPFQAIYLSKVKNKLVYKLVSLDQKSNWITADLIFDENSFIIYDSTVNSRKFGTFHTEHSYDDSIYPSRSIITFDIKKFKVPLKFIGREQSVTADRAKDKHTQGRITLLYTYLD